MEYSNIYKDSPIVILDEATAGVDADNERTIQESMLIWFRYWLFR